ncbi:ATP-dependent DNA helicase pif1 [Glycine max]|nr:ATP-dependent DNA helicase pif1 [Glycine max]
MDNHEHANHRDTAQARIKNKGIRQHKVNDQAQNIDFNIRDSSEDESSESTQGCVSISSPENQNYMSSANDPAINREGYSDLGDQLMQGSHCNENMCPHNQIQEHIVSQLSEMLDEFNVHAKTFRMVRDRLRDVQVDNIKLKLIANCEKDGRTYNVPTVPEVAALIVGDFDANSKRDIIIETQHGQLQRIHELHSSYLALQYLLLFPYGEDGYRPDIIQSSRSDERLSYIRNNPKKLRVDKFCSLQQSLDDGSRKGLNKGKRVILPLTFIGSPRYMIQLYFDGMAICSHVGFPNLFITLTCNPNWPEIHRLLNPLNLKAADRPDIISRVFKLKYEQMLMDLTKKHMLGKVTAYSDGFPIYRRRNNGNAIKKNGVIIDNRYIVPYNPRLLRKYQAHINIEWCNQSTSIKYLFKYINKGYDRVTAVLIHEDNDQTENGGTHNDEIKEYLDCRYICPCESTWRIFGFPIHGRKPVVERLHFYLRGQHSVLYEDHDDINDVLSKPSISDSKFISWMNTNQNFVEGRNLTYAKFVFKFVYNQKKRCWHLRKKGYTIGRLLWVPPITWELFYLRMMLTVCKGATPFEDLRTVDNVQYFTYKEACFAMGFLQDDKEFIEAIKEAKDWGSTHYIRKLFVLLLLTATMSKPEQVWDQTWHWMANDIVYNYKKSSTTPEDANCLAYLDNSLILAKLNYNNEERRSEFEHLFSHMTDEQASIYNQIVEAVNKDEGGMFFLYGYGGTGKTYIWKTLASSLRADNKIVIIVASSGIAFLLLPRGRTAYSKFKIPFPVFEDSTCNIHQGTQLAELLNQTSLIIWDEAPMTHKLCFEALDHSLRDIIKHNSKDNKIFGVKVMVFGGDFRQILPVIPRGSRSDIVNATINSSYL